MATNNPYDKYRQNQVMSATKEDLTLMLYEGALKFANQALKAIEDKNVDQANVLIQKVCDIIREFQITLNRDMEISKNFDQLYDYIYGLLMEANMKKDAAKLAEARDLIREFRDMWKEAMHQSRISGAAPVGARQG